ncbi:metallophosphoesterase [Paenibacillus sp. y28]|uniref:metallophosphoesterase n=1 Tax=Paenibacillus sp. y28 TaxID=3129110 RepID=UPI0030180677
MGRTLAISDIHGCCGELEALLARVKYNPGEDRLMLLGDFVDRGPRSRETVDLVMRLVQDEGAVALRGNHDQRFVDFIRIEEELTESQHQTRRKFLDHGGKQTLASYCGLSPHQIEDFGPGLEQMKHLIRTDYGHHLSFLQQLPLYAEDASHIYVHAGLNPDYPAWRDQPERDFMWIRENFIRKKTVVDKTVVFGHTKTFIIHGKPDIWFGGDKIGIDGGCSGGQQLNCLVIGAGAYAAVNVPAAVASSE